MLKLTESVFICPLVKTDGYHRIYRLLWSLLKYLGGDLVSFDLHTTVSLALVPEVFP